jgi:hypothetical protein
MAGGTCAMRVAVAARAGYTHGMQSAWLIEIAPV